MSTLLPSTHTHTHTHIHIHSGTSFIESLKSNNKKNGKTLARWSYDCQLPKFICTSLVTVQNVGSISATLCITVVLKVYISIQMLDLYVINNVCVCVCVCPHACVYV